MTDLQRIRFIRDLIDTAIEAAQASINTYGKSYLHVSREKIEHAAHWTAPLIERR